MAKRRVRSHVSNIRARWPQTASGVRATDPAVLQDRLPIPPLSRPNEAWKLQTACILCSLGIGQEETGFALLHRNSVIARSEIDEAIQT
jgi:hypothetical protein